MVPENREANRSESQMIAGERKPFGEIQGLLGGYNNILLVGCGTCVKVRFTPGR
jgi:hypothetical protein